MRYLIRQDYEGEPQWGQHRVPGMRPVLQNSYALFVGAAILPRWPDESTTVQLTLPEATAFNRPLDTERTTHVRYDALTNGVFTFGDYTFEATQIDGVNIRQAVRGAWSVSPQHLTDTVAAALSGASNLFEDPVFDQYFLVLTPLPPLPEGSAVIGSGLDESFFILATPNADPANLTHTIVHEVLHEWIPRRMGQTELETDPARAWFTEGFTEYFTQRVLLAAGLIDLETFAANFSDLWNTYQRSSVKDLPAEALNTRLFESRHTERLPYQRGALLALHWDTRLKNQQSQGLSAVITDLIDRAEQASGQVNTPQLSDADIHRALEHYLGREFSSLYQRHIVQGVPISADDLSLPACLVIDETGHWRVQQTQAPQSDCVETLVAR